MMSTQMLAKLREDRLAREKARLDKLRELNLKKYQDKAQDVSRRPSTVTLTAKKPIALDVKQKPSLPTQNVLKKPQNKTVISKIPDIVLTTPNEVKKGEIPTKIPSKTTNNLPFKPTGVVSKNDLNVTKKVSSEIAISKIESKFDRKKSYVPKVASKLAGPVTKVNSKADTRKSVIPQPSNVNRESVFDRLYKPKPKIVKQDDPAQRIQTDSKFRESVLDNAKLLMNRRATTHVPAVHPVRRSVSAVHFKRISKSELDKCNHKWASIGNNLDQAHLKDDEDALVKQDKITSAVKSERKKVKFLKPLSNMNTPRPEELQARLKSWLQKRGKSIDSFHHLQCFGLHHMARENLFDDENKENIQVNSDSDDDSFQENMNAKAEKWRRASYMSPNDCDETKETIQSEELMHNADEMHNVDELLLGALNDLAELVREGFDWDQSARWLRAIREQFPSATETAAYWECRAALEERVGNLPGSVQCWEEAIAKGTERSVVEANLDQLLDKFMQLKISPNSAKKTKVNSKLVEVKNVFKSTIIRFAVQQVKLRQSAHSEIPNYTVTPVRRSNRLSIACNKMTPRGPRTPLVQICASMKHIDESIAGKTVFVPNETLPQTP